MEPISRILGFNLALHIFEYTYVIMVFLDISRNIFGSILC